VRSLELSVSIRLSRVEEIPTECGVHFNIDIHLTAHALHAAYKPLFQAVKRSGLCLQTVRQIRRISVVSSRPTTRPREKVNHIHDTVLIQVSGMKDCRVWEILLLCCATGVLARRYREMAAFVLVEDPTEYRGRVEFGPG
jgi:hypothetical protein